MANLCNLDGVLVPEAEATVPVLDRGFLFGDSVYEVVRSRAGAPFAWAEHFDRLRLSAAAILMQLDLDDRTLARRIDATLAAASLGDSYVRIVVTRGTGSAPNIDLAYAPGPPRWLIMVRPLPAMSGQPARLALVDRLRVDRRALDPATKSGNYLNNVLGLAEAKARGATDCLMLNTDGFVSEASTSNVFARIDGTWCTPPLSAGILAGVTRRLLLDFLPGAAADVVERDLTAHELAAAEEVFLSSSLRDIAPVTHVDGAPIGGGKPGPESTRLLTAFRAFCERRLADVDGPRWRRLVDRGA
jgi:branched-chain amino acid aminotransferase